MGARMQRKLYLDKDDEDGISVVRELSRLNGPEWGMSGRSKSESPWDDDDTVVQRYFEETSTIGNRMKSRCISDDAQTRCPQGGLDSARPLTLSCCCRLASKLRKIEKVLARHNVEHDASDAQPQRSASRGSSIIWRGAPQHAAPQRPSLDPLAKEMQPVFRKAPALPPRHGVSLSFQTSGMKWFS